jgi:hypothetical protein
MSMRVSNFALHASRLFSTGKSPASLVYNEKQRCIHFGFLKV